jgi:hypothetical protein
MHEWPTFAGDETYTERCLDDAVVGDEVRFQRAVFCGTYTCPCFHHFELITGKIIRESFGKDKQQHTFTVQLDSGKITRIKDRNLYRHGTYRKPWVDEEQRKAAADEMHGRGYEADQARRERLLHHEEVMARFGFN